VVISTGSITRGGGDLDGLDHPSETVISTGSTT
jgi:hypothetical protein